MKLWISIAIALRALRGNPLRSLLTMLGIIIGVAAVITMVAIGSGAQKRIAERIQSLGANLFIITPGSQASGGVRYGAGTRHTLIKDDAAAIAREVPDVSVAAPAIWGSAQAVYGGRNWAATVVGAVPGHLVARDWQVTSGGSFTAAEVDVAAKVAVLGTTVADKLFEGDDPLGAQLRIGDVPFTVIGLLGPKGSDGSGRDQDDIILVPLSTAQMRVLGGSHKVDRRSVDYINVKVAAAEAMAEAERQITSLLRQRHGLAPETPDDFKVTNMTAVSEARQETSRALGVLLAAVASVSLVVGGISIMNIMLVSITERTREIGLRLAIGARRSDLCQQFLVEAVTLSLLGGLAGIALGALGAFLVAYFAGWPVLITPAAIAVAVGFSAAVGIFFGLYPALKASRLDPIEALRYE